MKFSLPKNIYSIISILNKNSFSAHVVGGCVRDMLIGTTPKDWDITTNASPDAVKTLFQKTYETGIKHGTITVSYEGTLVEVTTWRKETQYSDHRRPDHVYFTKSLTEDLARRDFTMNALAYHPDEGLIDPFNGLSDINLRTIRCVGDPLKRFLEDALRMLRAVRFSAQLGFQIEEKTFTAIKALSDDLAYVSMERIQIEVNKILESQTTDGIVLLWKTGLSKVIFPGIQELPPQWIEVAGRLTEVEDRKVILLALLFYTYFNNDAINHARGLLDRLKYDRTTLHGVTQHLQSLQGLGIFSERNIRRMATEYGEKTAKATLRIIGLLNTITGFGMSAISCNDSSGNHSDVGLISIKLTVSGLDLKNAGICQGRDIKTMLSVLSLCLYEKPELNDSDTLMRMVKHIIHLSIWTNSP